MIGALEVVAAAGSERTDEERDGHPVGVALEIGVALETRRPGLLQDDEFPLDRLHELARPVERFGVEGGAADWRSSSGRPSRSITRRPRSLRRSRPSGPCVPAYDSWLHDRLVDSVGLLSSSGARVVIGTAPIPLFGRAEELTRCLNSVHREVAGERADAGLVDLGEYVCPDDECQASIDGVELRSDGVDFEGEGAMLVSRWLAKQLLASSG